MEFRTECGQCHQALSEEISAYHCANECTFCATCARHLEFRCPNCSGELVRRPRGDAAGLVQGSTPPRPDPAVSVRRATVADLGTVAPLFDAYRVFYGRTSDRAAAERFLRDRLAHDESVVFVAEAEGAPLGFTQLYPMFTSISLGPTFVLNDLYVVPEGRRKGVGALLLAAARTHAVTNGAHYLELSTAVDNRAQLLYASNGWLLDREFLHYELPLLPGA